MEGRPWLRIPFILVGFSDGRSGARRAGKDRGTGEGIACGAAQPLHVEVSFTEPPRRLIWNTSEKQKLTGVLSCPDTTGQEKEKWCAIQGGQYERELVGIRR